MNNAQMTAIRMMAESLNFGKDGNWQVKDGKGHVIMFNLTEDRAKEYAEYYKGGFAEKMK